MNFPKELPVIMAEAPDLGRLVPHDAPHQGVVIEVEPLEDIWLADLLADAPEQAVLLVLDQVTDPHNVGAILRSAAAFGAIGIVTQDRHAPPESGALAKAASGALERVPWVRVVNLARALEEIAEAGFWRIGLAGEATTELKDALGPQRVALVLGAEGPGMRQNTREHCDALARLPITDESKASTSPTRPRSRSMRRASPDGPNRRNRFTPASTRWPSARRPSPRCSRPTASPSRGSASRASRPCCGRSSGQQVSVAAARSMWNKLTAKLGQPVDLQKLLECQRRGAARGRPVAAEGRLCAQPGRPGAVGRTRPRPSARGR